MSSDWDSREPRSRTDVSGPVRLAVLLLSGLTGCASAPRAPAASEGSTLGTTGSATGSDEPVERSITASRDDLIRDACAASEGIVVLPTQIATDWSGASITSGREALPIVWCGAGALHLTEIATDNGTTYSLDLTIEHGSSRPVLIWGLAEPGVMTLRLEGESIDGPVTGQGRVVVVHDPALIAATAACEQRGGAFGPMGMTGDWQCDAETVDGDASCRSNADCESLCIPDRYVAVADSSCGPGRDRVELRGHCHHRTVVLGCTCTGIADPVHSCATTGAAMPPLALPMCPP